MKTDKLTKWSNMQLPNPFKKVGYGIAIICLGLVVGQQIVGIFPEWARFLLSTMLLLGLLMVSLSKEKIEDEFIISLRSRSYQFAFIFGLGYTLILLPLVNYIADLIQGSAYSPVKNDYFDVLLLMILVQLVFFNKLKRCHC